MGLSVAQENDYWYLPLNHLPIVGMRQKNFEGQFDGSWFEFLQDHLIVMHNAKFDLQILENIGFRGHFKEVMDTMLMSHYIQENRFDHSLDSLSRDYCTVKKNTALAETLKLDWDHAFIEGMHRYAEEDAIATLQLYEALNKFMVSEYRTQWVDFDRPFMYLLKKMEVKGLLLNIPGCQETSAKCKKRMAEIEEELGFSPSKPSEYIPRLFDPVPDGYGLEPLGRTKGGKPQVNTKFLERTNHPVCGLMLEHRKLAKLVSSYYDSYVALAQTNDEGRLHPNIKQHGTVSGRTSCENPNMQQIPRESDVKHKLFLPEPDQHLIEIDFSALEPRLTSVYIGGKLHEIFVQNLDFHQTTADAIGKDRFTGKVANLTCFYGGVPSIMDTLNCSYKEAKVIVDKFNEAYPEVKKLAYQLQDLATRQGEVRLLNGRRRHFGNAPGLKFNNPKDALNSVIQGGGFEILKRSALRLDAAGFDVRNNVHDSNWIMFEDMGDIPEAERVMSKWTEEDFGLLFTVESTKLC